jgi:hypothetical protein
MGSPALLAQWAWDPTGLPEITRHMRLWTVSDGENALELHMIRLAEI